MNAIQQIHSALLGLLPLYIKVELEPPRPTTSKWWIDIMGQDYYMSIVWMDGTQFECFSYSINPANLFYEEPSFLIWDSEAEAIAGVLAIVQTW